MNDPEATLFAVTRQIASQGTPLIPRVVPPEAEFRQWDHYPQDDAVSPTTKSRWFYHAHPPEQREPGEHGHFHLFLPLSEFDGIEPLASPKSKNKRGKVPAKVVHLAALSFNTDGLPTHWFTVNRWVTNEFLMPGSAVADRLDRFDVSDAPGDALVNKWITAAVALYREEIGALLEERDAALNSADYEDRGKEILSSAAFEL